MKKCLFCGLEFEPNAHNQQYCSRKCSHSIRTKCAHCGKDIIRLKRKDGLYFCSRKCSDLYSGKTVETVCGYCEKHFETKKSVISYGWGKYCSKKCADKASERIHYLKCPQCGKTFVGDKDNWMKQKFCSKDCMKQAFRKPIEKELLQKLYVDEELTSREIGQIIGRSNKVVLDYLKYYNIPIKPDGIKNRERIKCKDGHLVRSYYERAFDNLLYKNDIKHEYDVRLPFAKRYMADFKVENVYVEIWGMMSLKKYRECRERKIQIYQKNNCVLLEIYPEDFRNIQSKLEELKSLMIS